MIRVDPELGLMRRCRYCREFWPFDLEFYGPRAGIYLRATCRACRLERQRGVTPPLRVRTPESIARRRVQDAARYQRRRADLEAVRAANRAAAARYYAAHGERIRERRRVGYAAQVGPVRLGFGRPRIAA